MKKKNKREPDDSRTEQKYTSGLYPETIDKTYAGIKCRANRQRRSKLMRPKRTGAFNSPLLLLSPRSITALALRGGPKERINSALTRGEGDGVGTSLQDRNALGAFNLPLFLLSPRSITTLAHRGGPWQGEAGLTAGARDK
jgi:hypothetical protein